MKTLTFNIICTLLIGLERGPQRDELVNYFQEMIMGMWSVPINLPFTRYNLSLKASARVQKMLKAVIREKRGELEQKGAAASHQDLVTCLLSMQSEENKEVLTENEIVHNLMLVMVAGHDTSSVLITFIMRLFATNQTVLEAVLQGMFLLPSFSSISASFCLDKKVSIFLFHFCKLLLLPTKGS